MNAFYVILAACPIVLLGAAGFLVMIVIGIRTGDRGELTAVPRNRLGAITHRVVGGRFRRDDADTSRG